MKDNWKKTISGIKSRCTNKNSPSYPRYGGRGIKCLITESELKTLWIRDKANNLKRPSIDRIDNDGDYIFNNCRFIETSLNAFLGATRRWSTPRKKKKCFTCRNIYTCGVKGRCFPCYRKLRQDGIVDMGIKKRCCIQGCGRFYTARNYCAKHYNELIWKPNNRDKIYK